MSIFDIPLNSPRLMIEANAGTGKTYTIEGLFVRLLLEKQVDLRSILVVTFTKKATAELQNRILEKMRMIVRSLKEPSNRANLPEDTFLHNLMRQREMHRTMDLERLQTAIYNFDEAQIFTIHSFCQRVLKEEALLTGMPFDVEIHQEDKLLNQATEDFWRVFTAEKSQTQLGKTMIELLAGMKIRTPAELQKVLKPLFDKPYATIHGTRYALEEFQDYIKEVGELKRTLSEMYQNRHNEILNKIQSSGVSKRIKWENRMNTAGDFLLSDSLYADDDKMKAIAELRHSHLDTKVNNNGQMVERDEFFEKCEEFVTSFDPLNDLPASLLYAAYEAIKDRKQKLLRRGEHITFSDLLSGVGNALQNPRTGKKLAERLFQKMPYALVDEFQDTDPVQYEIFRTIYGERDKDGSLMMIGDPKQSIYGFRGADIFTYLKAKEDSLRESSDALFVLKKNFRSRPSLIRAVNAFFTYKEHPFILQADIGEEQAGGEDIGGEDAGVEDAVNRERDFNRETQKREAYAMIGYEPSESGNPDLEQGICVDGTTPVAMKIYYSESGGGINEVKERIFQHLANEIKSMLIKASQGQFTLIKDGSHKPLAAGDVAVLVESNRDADTVKGVLKRHGIGAVTYSRETVFQSSEADAIYSFMRAVLAPGHTASFNRLLLSGLMGYDLTDVEQILKDDIKRVALVQELEELSEKWRKRGFYPAFRQFLNRDNRTEKIAEVYGAERMMTNLFHLADICSNVERDASMMPHALTDWFARQQSELDQDDEKTLLLESDLNLVKISTIHRAKGLEFPVVFCPTLWHGRNILKKQSGVQNFKEVHRNGEAFIHIDQTPSKLEQINDTYLRETIAENVRKVYVAMTRGKYLCYLYMYPNQNSKSPTHYTGLAALLTDPKQRFKAVNYKAALQDLVNQHPGILHFEEMANAQVDEWTDLALKPADGAQIQARVYQGRSPLSANRSQFSFSSLVHGGKSEEPDHDQVFEKYFGETETTETFEDQDHPLLLPKGATTGSFIHSLFEHPDFRFDRSNDPALEDLILQQLTRYRMDHNWVPAVRKILRWVCNTTFSDLNMNALQPEDQLREMEFQFPVRKPNSRSLFSIVRGEQAEQLPRDKRRDVMKGFIDLVARSGEKYYIIDYKSNYLGNRPENYQPEALKKAVMDAGYDLQYSIYTVALARHLKKWIPGFKPEKNLGGVAYLFVRGMDPAFGPQSGIYYCRPSAERMEELDRELSRTSAVINHP